MQERCAAATGEGRPIPHEIMGMWVCEQLGVTPLELRELGYRTAQEHIGYLEGKALAQWAADHPFGEKEK